MNRSTLIPSLSYENIEKEFFRGTGHETRALSYITNIQWSGLIVRPAAIGMTNRKSIVLKLELFQSLTLHLTLVRRVYK